MKATVFEFEKTGNGLLDFVDKFRSVTSLPKPNLCKLAAIEIDVPYIFE
jgi:hypothetical protein